MKKRIFTILFIMVLCLGTMLPVFAAEPNTRILDYADLLTDSEESELSQKLDEIRSRQNMDVAVATTSDLAGSSVQDYADELYIENGFGYGDDKDGLLLLISMEDSTWYLSTCGYGITAFTDDGISYIGSQISSDLSDGNYAAAFTAFAELCDDFITQARTGEPYDGSNLPREPLSAIWILISLVIGFIIAKIIVGNMSSQLKTVRTQAAASNYVAKDSMHITDTRDLFLYHNITKTEKPKNNAPKSSTHQSASGTTHGGGGGKF